MMMRKPPVGTLGIALTEAGVTKPMTPSERLSAIVIESILHHPGEDELAVHEIWQNIHHDDALIRALLEHNDGWENLLRVYVRGITRPGAQKLRGLTTNQPRREPTCFPPGQNGNNPSGKPRIPEPVVQPDHAGIITGIKQRALLQTFLVNGQPLGDLTPRECRAWARNRKRDGAFVERVIAGVPEDGQIKRYVTEDDAQRLYQQVQQEIF